MNSQRSSPPFQVRDKVKAEIEKLGDKAIIDGFVHVALKNYILPDSNKKINPPGLWHNGVALESCPYASNSDSARWPDDKTYQDAYWLKNETKELYGKYFDLTPEQVSNMTFNEAYKFSDAMISEEFETGKFKFDITPE